MTINFARIGRPSLVWRVMAAGATAAILLFGAAAFFIARFAIDQTARGVQDEVQASLREFQFLWKTRADSLARASSLLSSMSDVRGAFQTGDAATIRDVAADLWSRVSREDAIFLVFDPQGREIASLGGTAGIAANDLPYVGKILPRLEERFPAQAAGFVVQNDRLYYTIVTPVYVAAASGAALLNVLVTGFEMNQSFARALGQATSGTEFVFSTSSGVVAATLPPAHWKLSAADLAPSRTSIAGVQYASLTDPLPDFFGHTVGHLSVLRSLAAPDRRLSELKNRIALVLLVAVLLTSITSFLLARQIIDPIHRLDEAAAEISRRNYGFRIDLHREDEIGRLAQAFNSMVDSIQSARHELIAQERLNTIGRLSSSIVHDLRNPLAAIYGGAEMLADDEELPPAQARRLALSIYRASRHVQQLLSGLADSSRGRAEPIETCRLREIVEAARLTLCDAAENQKTSIVIQIPDDFELPLERSRIERVFLNLIGNSLEAMPEGGVISIAAHSQPSSIFISIDDTGVGIPEDVRQQLFLPFFSHGKRNGLGLGLALSRQTILDHGGQLWLERKTTPGARFCIRLPV